MLSFSFTPGNVRSPNSTALCLLELGIHSNPQQVEELQIHRFDVGCTILVHVGSPKHYNPKQEEEKQLV